MSNLGPEAMASAFEHSDLSLYSGTSLDGLRAKAVLTLIASQYVLYFVVPGEFGVTLLITRLLTAEN
jgi:hypothetical protein